MPEPLLRTSEEHLEHLLGQLRGATKPRTLERDCLVAHLERLCDKYDGYEPAKADVEYSGGQEVASG